MQILHIRLFAGHVDHFVVLSLERGRIALKLDILWAGNARAFFSTLHTVLNFRTEWKNTNENDRRNDKESTANPQNSTQTFHKFFQELAFFAHETNYFISRVRYAVFWYHYTSPINFLSSTTSLSFQIYYFCLPHIPQTQYSTRCIHNPYFSQFINNVFAIIRIDKKCSNCEI